MPDEMPTLSIGQAYDPSIRPGDVDQTDPTRNVLILRETGQWFLACYEESLWWPDVGPAMRDNQIRLWCELPYVIDE